MRLDRPKALQTAGTVSIALISYNTSTGVIEDCQSIHTAPAEAEGMPCGPGDHWQDREAAVQGIGLQSQGAGQPHFLAFQTAFALNEGTPGLIKHVQDKAVRGFGRAQASSSTRS